MRWLHLCDLHLGRGDDAQSIAMTKIVGAIENAVQDTTIDLVLFAGDIANSGAYEEYEAVIKEVVTPLRAIPALKNAIFVSVPGNHDLDCDGTIPIVWANLGTQRQNVFWNASEDGQELRLNRAKGFASYNRFLENADIQGLNPLVEVGSLLTIEGSKTVCIVCLNTALFSDKDFSDSEERGKSPLPVQALHQLAEQIPTGAQVLVLGHHPLTWFEAQSRNQFQSALTDYSAFYLHGHEHRVEVSFGPHYLRSIGFGATYPARLDGKSSQPYTSTFSVCELAEKLHVEFTSWDVSQGVWRPLHSTLPSDLRERSTVLQDGYSIATPTTRSGLVSAATVGRRDVVHRRQKIERPIWIEGNRVNTWAHLLYSIGLIEEPDSTLEEDPLPVPSHARFFVKGNTGTHLVHTATAETSVITYDHVERANTQLDTLRLTSCVIATFGRITSAALDLANSLRRSKNLEILDGGAISERLRGTRIFAQCEDLYSDLDEMVSFTPLVVEDGLAMLVVDAVENRWFSIIDAEGSIFEAHEPVIELVREKLPHLKLLSYRAQGRSAGEVVDSRRPEEFDSESYVKRCLAIFDTAQYAGFAAIGLRMPTESLRKIYVPTSANVEQQQAAVKATERAIEELVETLGLDEHQRDQLARQMKSKYGLQKSTEVGAASKLYQGFSNIVVLGDPGSGKSCFVRTEIMNYCDPSGNGDDDWYKTHIPVFLPLAEYVYSADEPTDLLDQCASHAHGERLQLSRGQLDVLLSRGRVAFFLDGLDEVRSIAGRERVLAELSILVERFAEIGNRFVLTSRSAAVRDAALPEALARVSLQGLTNDEIEALVHRLFEAGRDDRELTKDRDRAIIADILRDCAETPGIRRLARNPLLLTLLVFVYENSGAFAARRHLIYSQAIKTLVSVRHRQIRRAKVSESDLRIRLGRLAVAMFRREESALPTRSSVLDILASVMKTDRQRETDYIQDVAETTGLLIIHPRTAERANDLISFMHYSFLEYYTAIGFLDQPNSLSTVSEFALNPRWREVVTLMFGILGEQADITDHIRILARGHSETDGITVNRLLLALDCALECDVPPEETQRFLAEEVKTVLTTGSGRFVSEVRVELAQRIELILEATSSQYFRGMILEGIASVDGQVAAAFVDLASRVQVLCEEDEEVVEVISRAFDRNNLTINLAIINALQTVPKLRTNENLERLGNILDRGGIVEKTAALQLLDEQPTIIGIYSDVLREILYGDNVMLSAGAAAAIIRGGLFQKKEYTDLGVFDRALQAVGASDAPRRSLSGSVRITWERVEEWVFSEERNLRERGFRCLSLVESDSVRVHDLLFKCLRTETDSTVVTAILHSLASYSGAIQAASLAETVQVCRLTKSEFGNVRRAAARALRSFPTMEVVTSALIEQYQQLHGKFTTETRDVIRAISAHAVRDKSCRAVLIDEIVRLLARESPKWNKGNISMVSELLFAGDQIGVQMDVQDAAKLLTIAQDFRKPAEIRRLSMRLYGQTCPTNASSVRAITEEYGSHDPQRRLSAYRAGRRLLKRCREKYEAILLVVEALEEAKEALIRGWEREVSALGDRGDGTALREMRNLLVDIESTLGAYQEFAERITAEAFVGSSEESN